MSKWDNVYSGYKGGYMGDYYNFVKQYLGVNECKANNKYCQIGHTFCLSNEKIEGIYWFYETDGFIIDINDFYIKKEIVNSNFLDMNKSDMNKFMSFSSSYIIMANGESLNPYQTLSSNSLYLLDFEDLKNNYRFLLHSNSLYLNVGINFKKTMLDQCLLFNGNKIANSHSDIFLTNSSQITCKLEDIAKKILTCKMTSPAAELFFEAKAKEWLSNIVDNFTNKAAPEISIEDDRALENVANYLNDHYALNVNQETLEKISMMSGTKLKKLFKQKYQFSITEYTQRKRANIAETLLLNSSLKIQDISRCVGYSSPSKFSACFKKYKGIHPRDARKNINKQLVRCDCKK